MTHMKNTTKELRNYSKKTNNEKTKTTIYYIALVG